MSYTIRLLYDVEGWCYYWRCLALQKHVPIDFEVSIGSNFGEALKKKKHDLILQNAFSYAKEVKNHILNLKCNTLLVSVYTVGWGYANDWLTGCIRDSDYVIINNVEMYDKYGKHPQTFPISNGVDTSIFKVRKPIELRKPRVLWCGSIGHKKVKNYDSILVPLSNMLKKDGIPIDFKLTDSYGRSRMNQEQMSYWYNTGSIYVVASTTEGTPNTMLESAACGCVPVSTRVGNAPELIKDGINGYLCDTNVQSLYDGIKKAVSNYQVLSTNIQTTIKDWDWKYVSSKYYDLFRKLINEKK